MIKNFVQKNDSQDVTRVTEKEKCIEGNCEVENLVSWESSGFSWFRPKIGIKHLKGSQPELKFGPKNLT